MVRFALVAGLLQAGISIGVSSADSLFLTHIGAERLPRIYVIMPLIMLAFIPVSTFFLGRFGRAGLLKNSLLFLAVTGVPLAAGLIFLERNAAQWAGVLHYGYYFVKLFAELWAIVFFTFLWNFIDAYFDIQDAKRLFAFFSGGMALGAMAGGSLVAGLVAWIPVPYLFGVWSLVSALTIPVVAGVSRKWPSLEEEDPDQHLDAAGPAPESTLQSLFNSPYAIALALTILCTLMLTTLCEFQCMSIFEKGRGAAEIAGLFGMLILGVNVVNLFINFVLFNRLVSVFGVRAVALIQPVVYSVTFSYFLLRYGFGSAVFGYFAYQGILQSVEYNNQNFLFNALPARTKAALRTLIEGLCEPLATALAGLFLIFFAGQVLPETLSLVGLGGAIVIFCLVLWLRSAYGRAMIENLKSSWMDFSVSGRSLSVMSAADEEIIRNISSSPDRKKAVTALGLYWLYDRVRALEALLAYLEQCPPEEQDDAAPLVSRVLKEGDGRTVQRLLLWLRTTRQRVAPAVRQELLRSRLISADDIPSAPGMDTPEDRATSSVALWNSWKLEANLEGVNIMQHLMNGSHEERMAAISSLGRLERPRYIRLLAGFLHDASAAVRRQTLLALYELLDENSHELTAEFIQVIKRRDHADRDIALKALERMKNADSIRPLIAVSHRFTPFERRRTEHLVGTIGLKSIPILVVLLQDPAIRYEGRVLAARILGRLAFPQLHAVAPELLHEEIRRAYRFLCAAELFTRENGDGPAPAVCSEMADKVVRFVLEILTLSGQLPDFELIAASLRSANPKDRANAIETIEQACPRQVSHALLPLLDDRPLAEKTGFFRRTLGAQVPSRFELLREMVESAYDLTVAVAVSLVFKGTLGAAEDTAVRDSIQQRLLQAESGLVSGLLLSLLQRKYPSSGGDGAPDVIEKTTVLINSDFLGRFPLLELEDIIHASRVILVPDGSDVFTPGSAPDTVYVILDGTVETDAGDGPPVRHRTLGREILYGSTSYRGTARSRGARLLCLPRPVIMDTAQIHPIFAIELMAGKFRFPENGA